MKALVTVITSDPEPQPSKINETTNPPSCFHLFWFPVWLTTFICSYCDNPIFCVPPEICCYLVPTLQFIWTFSLAAISLLLKKEFIGPGLHLRPVCADRAWPPLQWTLHSVLSAGGNDKGRIRPPLGRGLLKKRKQTLITPASGQCLSKCNHSLMGY